MIAKAPRPGPSETLDLLADPSKHSEGTILVEGTVVDVCQKAGCWMVLSDGAQQIRIIMKDHAFEVAKDGTGAWAKVEGLLEAAEVKAETVEHLASESKRPDVMPEKTGQTWQLQATAVAFTRPAGEDVPAAPEEEAAPANQEESSES